MKSFILFFCFVITTVVVSGVVNSVEKKTFIFSGDINLNSIYSKGSGEKQEQQNDINRILEKHKEAKKADQEIKNIINESVDKIKKENNLNSLPESGMSKEEEEEAKEESTFLSDDLEEAAQNFASAEQGDESEEKEAENKNIKKYQAEVINAMNHDGPYKNIDAEEMNKIEHVMEYSDDTCDPDYSVPCPIHFFRTSSGCIPMKSYEGPCKKVQDKLPLLYDQQKESWGEICNARWPCIPEECPFGIDYNSICPVGWIDIGKGICSSIYENSNCPYDINMSKSTIEEKKKIAKECNLKWKCKSVNYLTNFDYPCPLNWTVVDEYKCRAPDNYEGDCPKISNLKKYNTEELKKQIEVVCLVNWPYTIKVNEYERDYDAPCPIGWFLTKKGICKGPENYKKKNNCNDEVAFTNMNSDQKKSYSTACNVDFPFKDRINCKRDYSFECPLGWVPSFKKGFCKSPLNYKSKICKTFSTFHNLSEGHKHYYKNTCNIDWPCEGEIQDSLIYTKIYLNHEDNIVRKNVRSGAVDSETGSIF